MENIVKPELTAATWQKTADLTGLAIAIIALSVLGVIAAVNAASTFSSVIAALVGLSAALFAPATYAISQSNKN